MGFSCAPVSSNCTKRRLHHGRGGKKPHQGVEKMEKTGRRQEKRLTIKKDAQSGSGAKISGGSNMAWPDQPLMRKKKTALLPMAK